MRFPLNVTRLSVLTNLFKITNLSAAQQFKHIYTIQGALIMILLSLDKTVLENHILEAHVDGYDRTGPM